MRNVLAVSLDHRAVVLALLALPLPSFASGWEQINEEDGVTVYSKEVPGSKLIAFKGETVYDEPMGRVLDVLLDNDHRTEWVGRLYLNQVIDRKNDFDYVIYQAFALPAIFSNRDYVYHGRAERDASGVVTLQMQSIEHAKAPETVGVRAELVNSRYVLTPVSDDKTRVEVEIMTDPKGMMPAWLVNMIQKDWPLDTLGGIRGQFAKPHVGTHPLPPVPGEIARELELITEEAPVEEAAPVEGAPAEGAPAEEAAAPLESGSAEGASVE